MKNQKTSTTIREDAGKLLLDLGKLVFGSIFLGGVLRGEIPQTILVIAGFSGAAIFCICGLFLSAKKKKASEVNSQSKQEP
ncbi:MAG: hypothetical protein FWC97_12345 [Treponema sp.]|nr:hypothetical protein [Treponema sp.]